MSFSSDVKTELCHVGLNRPCCAAAEVYGVLLFANSFSPQEARIITGSGDFAQRLPRLMQRVFGFEFDSQTGGEEKGKCVFRLTDREKLSAVFARFGADMEGHLAHHVNFALLEEDCCRAAFIRGAFLAGGSITDPAKRYHLELVTDHKSVAGECFVLLREMGFTPKETTRHGHYVIYFKQSEAIEDLFTTIGAPQAALALMSAKVEKDMRNAVNRRVNCDSANADKIVSAAQTQLEHIRALERGAGLDALPEELRDLALLRIANPEASLTDLAALSDPPLSKSAVNHRMRKLMSVGRGDSARQTSDL